MLNFLFNLTNRIDVVDCKKAFAWTFKMAASQLLYLHLAVIHCKRPQWYHPQPCTVKPVLSGHSKINKIKVLKTKGSLMKVESIAECSLGAFCNTFDLH